MLFHIFYVIIVSVIHCIASKHAIELAVPAAQGLKHVNACGEPLPVQIRNFDWHFFLKQVKESRTAQELWTSLGAFVVPCGMAVGTQAASGAAARPPQPEP